MRCGIVYEYRNLKLTELDMILRASIRVENFPTPEITSLFQNNLLGEFPRRECQSEGHSFHG